MRAKVTRHENAMKSATTEYIARKYARGAMTHSWQFASRKSTSTKEQKHNRHLLPGAC
jgi:hypothetical protein